MTVRGGREGWTRDTKDLLLIWDSPISTGKGRETITPAGKAADEATPMSTTLAEAVSLVNRPYQPRPLETAIMTTGEDWSWKEEDPRDIGTLTNQEKWRKIGTVAKENLNLGDEGSISLAQTRAVITQKGVEGCRRTWTADIRVVLLPKAPLELTRVGRELLIQKGTNSINSMSREVRRQEGKGDQA